jgi:hypothetical protein
MNGDMPGTMNFLKRLSLFEVLLVVSILGVHLYAALSDAYNFPNFWFKRDDAFYYFKVAQNITEGYGSTFDGINPTNGYHPLWMIVCIPIFALARFDVILPLRVLLMVIAVMQAVTAILLYRLIRDNLSRAVGILAASFWAFGFYIHYTVYEFGLETPLAALAVVLFIYKLSRFEQEWRSTPVTTRQIAELALIAVVVMFSRLDLVFLTIITGAWIIFRGKPLRTLLLLDLVVIFASMTSSVALRTGIAPYNEFYSSSAVEATILAIFAKVIALYFFGAYQHPRANSLWIRFRQLFFAVTTGTIITVVLYLILVQFGIGANFPRSAFLLDWGISLILFFALRLAAGWFSNPNLSAAETPVNEFRANWKTWLTEGVTYYGILGGFLAAYMLFNKLMFGTSSPVSGQIKRWWGSIPVTLYEGAASNWFSFFGVGRDHFNAWQPLTELFYWGAEILRPLHPGAGRAAADRYYMAMLIFLLVALVILFINKRRTTNVLSNMAVIPLAAGIGFHILSYTTTSYGGAKEWYWVSEMVMIVLAGSLLLHLILKPLQRFKPAHLMVEISAVLVSIYLGYNLSQVIVKVMVHDYFPPDRAYMEVVEFLEENTPPGSVIGMTGGGNVGYLIKDRTIVNMDGLINSHEYFIALKNREAAPYLVEHGMTIVFANPHLLTMSPYYGQFAPYLVSFNSFGGKDLLYLLKEPKY